MDTLIYCFITVAYIVLLVWGLIMASRGGSIWSLRSFVYLVLLGLIVDNSILAMGSLLGEGNLLLNLNLARYWSHALLTPTLVLFTLGVLRTAGVKGMNRPIALYGAVLFTAALIIIELTTETIGMKLAPVREYGVLRYVSAEPAGGPPVMIILVSLVLIVTGFILLRKSSCVWMFVGSVAMALGSVIPFPVQSAAFTNGFELLLLITLVATIQQQESIKRPG